MKFALTDMLDIGKYVAQIVADPRTINRRILAYTEILSMNEIWEVMAKASGEEPPKEYVWKHTYILRARRSWLTSTSLSVGIGSRTPRDRRIVSEKT